MNKKSHEWGTAIQAGFVLALLIAFCVACAPTRQVYIPPEWKTQPPPAASAPKLRQPAATASPGQGPVLKPAPEFKEMDVSVTQEAGPPPQQEKKQPPQQQPQYLASMHLVDQAKANLAKGKPDAAIPIFEQAVQVDVHNGEAFMGLARAWRLKGSREKAVEFARKAEILFQDDPGKLKEVFLFEADIYKEMGDSNKASLYKQKASRLK